MDFEREFSVDDGDEGCSFSLGEREWHSYLATVDSEIGNILKLFIDSRHVVNHLDMILSAMKMKKVFFLDGNFVDNDGVEVITFHKHPINVVSKAIFFFIEKIWDILVAESKNLTVSACWNFSKLINNMQTEMLSGVANIDSYEYLLGICHFKKVISAVNDALFSIKKLPEIDSGLPGFVKDFTIALFDVRELAWQSISLCNVAEKRYNDEQ